MPRIAARSKAERYGRERMTATGSMASGPADVEAATGPAATGPAADGGVDGSCESVIRCASLNETTQTLAALQWTQPTPDEPGATRSHGRLSRGLRADPPLWAKPTTATTPGSDPRSDRLRWRS